MKLTEEIIKIKDNYCIGCGICSAVSNGRIKLDDFGKYNLCTEHFGISETKEILDVCPFSPHVNNENKLADVFLKGEKFLANNILGKFLSNYIGHVKNNDIRMNSSSGGLITWILIKLLENKLITHAIHIGKKEKNEQLLFNYVVSNSKKGVIDGASSKYYPIEMSSVLNFIKNNEGQFAIVALPCFAKGIRNLQLKDEIFKKRIKFVISPICGHLKSINYATFLAWQKNILPGNLDSINFRKKIEGAPSSKYGTQFSYISNNSKKSIIAKNIDFKMGTDWGHGMFKYPACDFCDDIVGEVADISVGDAWLPEYTDDYKGNSVAVVRNLLLDEIIKKGIEVGELKIELVSPEIVERSQIGGIRHKREDLAYRIYLKEKNNEWYPIKRVKASSKHSYKRKKIIKARIKISALSHKLFKKALLNNDLNYFLKNMKPEIFRYELLYRSLLGKIIFILKKIKLLKYNK